MSHHPRDHVAVLYFFCNFQERKQQSITKVLASLARQLFEQRYSQLRSFDEQDALRKTLEEHLSSRTTKDLKALLVSFADEFSRIYVVLDALDEFSSILEHRKRLLSALSELQILSADTKGLRTQSERLDDGVAFWLCVSSRADQEARQALGVRAATTVQPDSTSIRAFITGSLEQCATLSRYSERAELYRQIVDQVEKQSDCM